MDILLHKKTDAGHPSCVEIRAEEARIILLSGHDASGPLTPSSEAHPAVSAHAPDAVLIGEFDPEKYRALRQALTSVPIYLSKAAVIMAEVEEAFLPVKLPRPVLNEARPGRRFTAGKAEMTPMRSVGAAMKFLISTPEGSVLFDPLGQIEPVQADAMVTSRPPGTASEQGALTPAELRRSIEKVLSGKEDIALIFASPYDTGVIAEAHKACLNSDSIFILDLRSAFLFERLKKLDKGVPSTDSRAVRVRFDKARVEKLEKAGYRSLLFFLGKKKIDIFSINRRRGRTLLLADPSGDLIDLIRKMDGANGAKAIIPVRYGEPDPAVMKLCADRGLKPVVLRVKDGSR